MSSSHVTGSNQTVSRRLKDGTRREDDSFLLSLQLSKTGFVEQGGRLTRLEPGDFALYSSASHYRLTLPDDFSQLVLQFPRADFIARLPSADGLTAITVPAGVAFGSIAREMLPKLVRALDETPDHAQVSGQQAIIDLVVAALAAMAPGGHQLHSNEQLILMRARAFILRHLSDPQLDREAVAREMGLSVRRLNEIFQTEGSSISREISDARLSRVAADLGSRQHARRSVGEIAFAVGVSNMQSFTRSFRARFGQTPAEYRAGLLRDG